MDVIVWNMQHNEANWAPLRPKDALDRKAARVRRSMASLATAALPVAIGLVVD